MKYLLTTLLASLCFICGRSQTAASYLETSTMTTYTDIAGLMGAVTASLACDDCNQTGIPIGFTFNYCGSAYTSLSASSNGFLSLDNSAIPVSGNATSNIAGAGFIMPYWDDLSGLHKPGASTTPSAHYITTGIAPNRVFTFEWQKFNQTTGTCVGCIADIQVKLYETSGTIEFVYGLNSFTGMSATIGIANSTTDWQTLDGIGPMPIPSSAIFTSSLTAAPLKGQLYRWFHPCTGTPSAGTIDPSPANGCHSFSSLLTLVGSAATFAGVMNEWLTSSDGVTWTAMTSFYTDTVTVAVTGTRYFRCKVGCAFSGLSDTTEAITLTADEITPITGRDTACMEHTITLTDATPGGTWTSSNPAVATVSSTGVVTGLATGTATISYSALTCTATKKLRVDKLCDVGVDMVLGKENAMLNVFPNPNTGTFSVMLASRLKEEMTVTITDMTGKQIKQVTANTNENIPITQTLPQGMYLITASTSGGHYVSRLVIN